MNALTHTPSNYAKAIVERGEEVLSREIRRLQDMIIEARDLIPRGSSARIPLEIDVSVPDSECPAAMARMLDSLMDAIVRSQRLVDHWSRASAILFLDKDKRQRWSSYGAYRESCDKHLTRVLASM